MLSITQLRQLLREYSLPTGGNKNSLVSRLIMYLETFCPNQQGLLVQFSRKLKKLLSVDPNPNNSQNSNDNQLFLLPPEISQRIHESSPSCLFETTEHAFGFGPVMIQNKIPSDIHEFSLLNCPSGTIPVLQMAPVLIDAPLKRVTIQLDSVFISFTDPIFWCSMQSFVGKIGTIQVTLIDPPVPIILVIRYLKSVPVASLVKEIIEKRPPPPDFVSPGTIYTPVCPLTRKIMLYPARGENCSHSKCFDLSGFLCRAIKNNMWICPICHKMISPEELRVDFLYHTLYSQS